MALRSEESHQAVLKTTMSLLDPDQGTGLSVQKLSIERIARDSGVSKTTIYRWWPNKVAVVIDSFLANHIARTPVRDDLPAMESLREHMASLAAIYASNEGRLIAQLIAECQHDPAAMQEFKERFWLKRQVAATSIIHRSQEEGSIRADLAAENVAELLYAPIYFRLLLQAGALDQDWTDKLLNVALDGIRAS
ncbi:TetR/AcrR family transcriptional regulator C-terminal ligand-binding domain-containing protein [Kocuria sp.]|uniref:TetR/AcrR family transcriptional regulator n=1 Tax=Kocuria TaxID=57493 RepID=UPI0025B7BCE0|nr:TetR/AcrR family transcriptional regulator C-terminal ligand-binding domain-containing protein [Kocuria sp.]